MSKYYVPYAGDIPASIDIKGHKLVIVSHEEGDIAGLLEDLGASQVRELILRDNTEDQTAAFAALADQVKGGVVLAPPGISAKAMLLNLEHELPWVH